MRFVCQLVSTVKSFRASRCLCGFRAAFGLPVRVSARTVLADLSGRLQYPSSEKTALRIGFDKVGIFDQKASRPILSIAGEIVLKGSANFGQGASINVGPKGVLTIGNKFNNTAGLAIVCTHSITIGSDVLASWDTLIMDTDFHVVIDTETGGATGDVASPVIIGDRVWIGCRSTILKGSAIPDGCIIGAGSLVSRKFADTDALIAGNPATVMKRNVTRAI